jgi:mono/diheme cytochrome c family protein
MKKRKIFSTILIVILLGLNTQCLYAGSKQAQRLFEKKCSACHSLDRVDNIEKTTTGWKKTVFWMQSRSKNYFSDKQAKIIASYINDQHSYFPKQLFLKRCATCHPWQVVEKLSLTHKQWDALVMRQRSRAITWINLDEVKDIADYLNKTYPDKKNSNAPSRIRQKVETKCIRCHLHPTVFTPSLQKKEWIVINKRMQGKSPELLNDPDVEEISEYLSQVNPLPEWE